MRATELRCVAINAIVVPLWPSGASGTRATVLFALIVAIVAAIYLPGLAGPFVFDDFANLASTMRFHDGELAWQGVIFSNSSGLLGRPISMASFVLSAAVLGVEPWVFKAVNLALHLANGVLLWIILRLVNRQLPSDVQISDFARLLICVFWLAAPSNVSTVLYVVQRMAILSTFFALLSLIAFLHARSLFLDKRMLKGWLHAALLAPACIFAATYSKENGILVVPMIVALNFLLSHQMSDTPAISRRGWLVLVAAAMAAIIWVVFNGVPFSAGYEYRDFSLAERLLSQPRAVATYALNLLAPISTNLGVVQDDFEISRSLWTPWTTLPAIGLLVFLLGAGVYAVRRRLFWISLGVAWFFIGHAMESTFIPLEMYFEHRNYLPGIGLLILVYGVSRELTMAPSSLRGLKLVGGVYGLLVSFVLWNTVQVWSSPRAMLARDVAVAPNSMRTVSGILDYSMRQDMLGADNTLLAGAESSLAREPVTLALWLIIKGCATGSTIDPDLLRDLGLREDQPSLTDMSLMESIDDKFRTGTCPTGDAGQIGAAFTAWLDRAEKRSIGHWKPRYFAAMMIAESGDFDRAAGLLSAVWERSDRAASVGISLFQLNATLERWDTCSAITAYLEAHNHGYDQKINEAIKAFRAAVDAAKLKSQPR